MATRKTTTAAAAAVAPEASRSRLTVNGKPIPLDFEHVIPYSMTDQGRVEALEGKLVTDNPVTITSSPFDKQLQRVENDPDYLSDPFAEVAKPHEAAAPDMHFRLVSDRAIKRRGMRGYEIVKDPKTGEPVRVNELMLARQPQKAVLDRRRRQRALAIDALPAEQEKSRETQTAIIRNAPNNAGAGFAPLRADELMIDSERPSAGGRQVGVSLTRLSADFHAETDAA